MDSRVEELQKVSLYEPRRYEILYDLLNDEFAMENDTLAREVVEESKNKSIDDLYLYTFCKEKKRECWCDFDNLLSLRKQLKVFYTDLRRTDQKSIEQLLELVVKAGKENSTDFWKWHFYFKVHVSCNEYNFQENPSLAQKCLFVEKMFCEKCSSVSGLKQGVKKVFAFDNRFGNSSESLGIMERYLLQGKQEIEIDDSCLSAISQSNAITKMDEIFRYHKPLSLESAFNYWIHDKGIVCCFGVSNVEKLRNCIAEYFSEFTEQQVSLDLIEKVTKRALNDAARGVDFLAIQKELDKTKDLLCTSIYKKDLELILDVTSSKCKEMINYEKKRNGRDC